MRNALFGSARGAVCAELLPFTLCADELSGDERKPDCFSQPVILSCSALSDYTPSVGNFFNGALFCRLLDLRFDSSYLYCQSPCC